MIDALEVAAYLDGLLGTKEIPDYPNALNGLQLSNEKGVSRVAASVDFSTRTVSQAIDEKANLLLVHHGMFWSGITPITGVIYRRLRMLLENDVAVYASHLPLDAHPEFGNNMLLSRKLGLDPSEKFAKYRDTFIGVSGTSDMSVTELFERAKIFASSHGGVAVSTGFTEKQQVSRWGMCTGAGASAETLHEANAKGIETLIVGEGPHWTAVEATELGMVVIYAGHYATETLGVEALARHAAKEFDLEWTMIHAPTGL